MLESHADSPFVGRSDELDRLLTALDTVRGGVTTLTLVGGETGIGKTRLVTEALIRQPPETVIVRAQAIDVAEKPPLGPILEGLRQLVRQPGSTHLLDALQPWHERLAIAGPVVSPGDTRSANAPVSVETLTVVDLGYRVLADLAPRRTVVVAIDDLQWADRSTRDLLVRLLASPFREGLGVVATYRAGDLAATDPLYQLLPELRRNRRVRSIDLGPLDARAIDELVTSLGGERARASSETIWRRSEGNPFVAEQTIRAVEDGAGDGVPQTLRQMVLGRVAALPDASQAVLRAVVLAGQPVDHDDLASVVELDPRKLLVAVRSAVDASILAVTADAEYSIRHALYREVIESELLPGERRHLHQRFAEALSTGPDSSDARTLNRLAHHWEGARNWPLALDAALGAAAHARSLHSHGEAYRQLSHALDLFALMDPPSDAIDRPRLLEAAAEAATLAGEHSEAVRLMRECLTVSSDDNVELSHRHQLLARYLSAAGNVRDALGEYELAVALAEESSDQARRAAVLGSYAEALLLAGNIVSGRAEAERAVALASEAGAGTAHARALATLGASLAYLADPEAGIAALGQALEIAETTGQPEDIGRVLISTAELLAGPLNELERAVSFARDGLGRVRRLGLDRTAGVELHAITAKALFRLGRWNEADTELDSALASEPTGSQSIELRLAKARLLVGWGDLANAEAELEALELLCSDSVGPRYRAPILTLRAGLALWQGDPLAAREAVASGLSIVPPDSDDVFLIAPLVWHGLRAIADEMDASGTGADLQHLAAEGPEALFVGRMQILSERVGAAPPALADSIEGYLKLCDGELSRAHGNSDPATWARAAEIWERNGHPYPMAYCWYRHADALLSRQRRSAEAVRSLRRAHDVVSWIGARPLLADIAELATRARVDLSDPSPAKHDVAVSAGSTASPSRARGASGRLTALSRRELAVLAELADGRTNRQIAQRLFISERTVNAHVSHIFEKLGVHSRVQAAGLLHLQNRAEAPSER